MIHLNLKPEYQGTKVTIKHPIMGEITFDSEINNSSEYPFFNENGFSHLFTHHTHAKYQGIRVDKNKEINKLNDEQGN